MEGRGLVDKLNAYPMWVDFDPQTRSEAYNTVGALGDVYKSRDARGAETDYFRTRPPGAESDV